ncbi:hypothetical protein AMTR_s00131p00082040 [Amborella trichopoda]|uniref:Uncharacterized protein n=1 Tax=Amborella trichopoda TaxID=13333 RepID=W1NVR8_AMBTC|nr:hypothetical protein AMTR_s00131p00082040 [Amborella trichopoda]
MAKIVFYELKVQGILPEQCPKSLPYGLSKTNRGVKSLLGVDYRSKEAPNMQCLCSKAKATVTQLK